MPRADFVRAMVVALVLPVAAACSPPAAVRSAELRADACGRQRDHDCAIASYTEVLRHRTDDYRIYYNRGVAYFWTGRYEQAEADYGSALRFRPDLAAGLTNRCLARAVIGRAFDEAMADCDRALALLPDRAEVPDARGFLHLRMAMFAEAIADFDAALEIDAQYAPALYGRGYAKAKTGDAAGGETDETAALNIDAGIATKFSRFGVK